MAIQGNTTSASACGFTSRQVEGMCLARPPSAQRKKTDHTQVTQQEVQIVKPVSGPTLNIIDVPEAGLAGTRRGRSDGSSQAHRGERSLRKAALVFNQEDAEMPTEDDQQDDAGSHANPLEVAWACPACTFLNAGPLLACEMCGSSRKQIQQYVHSADLPDKNFAMWPTLHEAYEDSWGFCELSSIASSWHELEQPEAGFKEEDDASSVSSFCVIVDMPPAERAAMSWADRIPGGRAPHLPKILAPPLWHKQGARKTRSREAKGQDSEGCDLDDLNGLEDLNERRLHPSSRRGLAQRRRCARHIGCRLR